MRLNAIIRKEELLSKKELYNSIEYDWNFQTAWHWRSHYSLRIETAGEDKHIPSGPGEINKVPEELFRRIVGYLDIHSDRMFACTSKRMFYYT